MMIEYFIALRASRLDDRGEIHPAQYYIRHGSDVILKRAALVEMAYTEMRKLYPVGGRWFGHQYSFDGKEWIDV